MGLKEVPLTEEGGEWAEEDQVEDELRASSLFWWLAYFTDDTDIVKC